MHPVQIDDKEFSLMKRANEKKDWRLLPTWRLRYLYQRFIALPTKDFKSIKEIADEARQVNFRTCEIKENMIKYNRDKIPF